MSAVKINDEVKIQIQGRILNDKNSPVPYASIRITGSSTGVSADSAGSFMLKATADLSSIELRVSSVGYQAKNIQIDKTGNIKSVAAANGIITLDTGDVLLTAQKMDEVIVTGNTLQGLYGIAGGVSVCRRTTRYEKAKNKFKEVLGTNEIKVYPNPISLNSVFSIRFNVKDPGEYALQFTDASGKIIAARQLNISSKNQLENFNGDMFRANGIYFVSITGKQHTKLYTAKLLVQ
jgi:hypothetical protein